ncbi:MULTISPECIES: chemotaxis response regulator protein-glutamate methylesterase [Methylophaga]|jgi:two-component system chemotaxis response regulator CheB|uniref:Protein-glutamate methylesterase/protein-glutamine glutaminase n=2 Tax=Methylophaga TaxID=40222 RepID=A0ABN0TSM7_9GAMM|nr:MULTISPECIES: chemotaxis response regulator protein-glutamate methylesterase [Methylophaga]BDZ73339.1 chemotaxis response regulator protein-glutamate methylesterase of group 1 operon [Methylophaga marina]|tara:strand:+ start:5305 stop:6372 length:1068 start_codon:yes stop_codon:yes gene_type:complete
MKKISVIVIDDSALVRKLLTEILNSDPELEVVATAGDPYQARDKIKQFNPDVLTLDVEMPKMDGVTFLRNLMRLRPMPVVMVSTLTEKGAQITLEAMALGAFDFVEKPKLDLSQTLSSYSEEIISKIKAAAGVQPQQLTTKAMLEVEERLTADAVIAKSTKNIPLKTTEKIVAIGASTGGTEAIKTVLCALPANAPGIVITQHIPASFSAPFAERVNKMSALNVSQAIDGEQILPGHAYIAPGDKHLLVERSGARYYCRLNDGPAVSRHKPSVDVLFRSIAQNVGANAIGVMLTGMGDDGARGMLEMRENGASNMVQDEKSSVVWGMPGAAYKLGAAELMLPLDKIAQEIMKQGR